MLPIDSCWDYSMIPSAFGRPAVKKVSLSEQIDRFEQVLIASRTPSPSIGEMRSWRAAAWEFRNERSTTRFESSGCQLMPSGL